MLIDFFILLTLLMLTQRSLSVENVDEYWAKIVPGGKNESGIEGKRVERVYKRKKEERNREE